VSNEHKTIIATKNTILRYIKNFLQALSVMVGLVLFSFALHIKSHSFKAMFSQERNATQRETTHSAVIWCVVLRVVNSC